MLGRDDGVVDDGLEHDGGSANGKGRDQMLMERHLNKKARRSSHKNHIKGPKKRTEEDDERFAQSFEKMIRMAVESEM